MHHTCMHMHEHAHTHAQRGKRQDTQADLHTRTQRHTPCFALSVANPLLKGSQRRELRLAPLTGQFQGPAGSAPLKLPFLVLITSIQLKPSPLAVVLVEGCDFHRLQQQKPFNHTRFWVFEPGRRGLFNGEATGARNLRWVAWKGYEFREALWIGKIWLRTQEQELGR